MLRTDVKNAIDRLWPEHVVEMDVDYESTWFLDVQQELTRALGSLRGARLRFQRDACGAQRSDALSDGDPQDDYEHSRSYHLYFVVPDGAAFQFTAQTEGYVIDGSEEEEPSLETVCGNGYVGWCVAVSLMAPFAVITLGERIEYENGDSTEPTIEWLIQSEDGRWLEAEQHYRETTSKRVYARLQAVRRRISEALAKYDVAVLADSEWKKRVPGLRAGEGVLVETPLRVLDALFFEGI